MNFDLTGKLLEKNDIQKITETFQKREFVVECEENNAGRVWTDYIKFQLIQDKCDILDQYNVGDTIKVTFNIKGNKWEKEGNVNYFVNLNAWRIEAGGEHVDPFAAEQAAQAQAEAAIYGGASDSSSSSTDSSADDLPF
ncbi:MAG: DUF3127 domain-containing protein [Cytophagales bacterium]|nr:DUF3127 domain-containing protein [Cytophagales bacterium]